jgi:uncharacterized protein (DUF433 family)
MQEHSLRREIQRFSDDVQRPWCRSRRSHQRHVPAVLIDLGSALLSQGQNDVWVLHGQGATRSLDLIIPRENDFERSFFIMVEPQIINKGRGPEIAGTRITVFDVLEYNKKGWHRDEIAVLFDLSSQQVEAAIRYIEEHRDEVMATYERIIERINRGNPAEIQAKLDAGRERFLAVVKEYRETRTPEARDAGHSGGH